MRSPLDSHACRTTISHIYRTSDERIYELYVQKVPSLIVSPFQFLNGAAWMLMICKLSPEYFSPMLYTIKIRGHRRSVHSQNIFNFKEVVDVGRTVRTCVVTHEYESRTDSNSEQVNVRVKDSIFVSYLRNKSAISKI